MKQALLRILNKLTSGRFILTLSCAIVFIYCVYTRQLEAATITAILLAVIKDYFNRDRNGGNDVGGDKK